MVALQNSVVHKLGLRATLNSKEPKVRGEGVNVFYQDSASLEAFVTIKCCCG